MQDELTGARIWFDFTDEEKKFFADVILYVTHISVLICCAASNQRLFYNTVVRPNVISRTDRSVNWSDNRVKTAVRLIIKYKDDDVACGVTDRVISSTHIPFLRPRLVDFLIRYILVFTDSCWQNCRTLWSCQLFGTKVDASVSQTWNHSLRYGVNISLL